MQKHGGDRRQRFTIKKISCYAFGIFLNLFWDRVLLCIQARLELMIHLPWLPECWDYKCALPCQALFLWTSKVSKKTLTKMTRDYNAHCSQFLPQLSYEHLTQNTSSISVYRMTEQNWRKTKIQFMSNHIKQFTKAIPCHVWEKHGTKPEVAPFYHTLYHLSCQRRSARDNTAVYIPPKVGTGRQQTSFLPPTFRCWD
jgi:hypothetical protein